MSQEQLEKRIIAAIDNPNIGTEELIELIDEVKAVDAAIIAADESEQEVDQITSLASKVELARDRLRAVLPRLQEMGRARENRERWFAVYKRVEAMRDAAAERLSRYPELTDEMIEAFREAKRLDEVVHLVNLSAPSGVAQRLSSVELHARGLKKLSGDNPSLLESTRLIDWESGREIWPPPTTPLAVLAANSTLPYESRDASWAEDNERRAAERRADQQRMANHYAQLTQEQEKRENAEALERFLEQQGRLSVNRNPSRE
jgi:hypothetical protein